MYPLIYDIEILKAVPDRKFPRVVGVEYCEGWHDHKNMGITVIGAFDYKDNRYRIFLEDNFNEFAQLCCEPSRLLVGYNNKAFDNSVLLHHQLLPADNGDFYDLLVEVWGACGLGPLFEYPSHIGFGLDAMCKAAFGMSKTGHGALAPVDWQQGKRGKVIDYCLNDVFLTKRLFDMVLSGAALKHPMTGEDLFLRVPK